MSDNIYLRLIKLASHIQHSSKMSSPLFLLTTHCYTGIALSSQTIMICMEHIHILPCYMSLIHFHTFYLQTSPSLPFGLSVETKTMCCWHCRLLLEYLDSLPKLHKIFFVFTSQPLFVCIVPSLQNKFQVSACSGMGLIIHQQPPK